MSQPRPKTQIRKPPPPHPLHCIWRKLRGPFRILRCEAHSWERYDVQNAGCLRCGAHHTCRVHLDESDCPLMRMDDCSICCTITGFCVPTVRYSDNEFVEGVSYAQTRHDAQKRAKVTFDEIYSVVHWFLSGQQSVNCKKDEIDKSISKFHATSLKVLKSKKLRSGGEGLKLPCVPSILAQTLSQLRLKMYSRATPTVCRFCASHITQCLNKLQLINAQSRKINLVLGMLYLMKQGLVIQNTQWLPKTPELMHCLPHETCLEKTFKLSMKLVCETENEIKLALRQLVKLT